jgi:lysophospholipase L1-like esterase
MTKRRSAILACWILVLLSPTALAQQSTRLARRNHGPSMPRGAHWIATWESSQQIPEPRNALASGDLRDSTLRQIVHPSLRAKTLRVHLSNAFGTAPLEFTSVHVAVPVSAASPKIEPATDRALRFSGRPAVRIPAGAEYISDPVSFAAAPDSSLAITFHLAEPPAQQTSHPGSRATSYLAHGDHVSDADLPDATQFEHWFNLAGVDVEAPSDARAIVALGDSITDGHGSTTNGNDRWTDDLARRLHAAGLDRSVLNQGIGGNRLLLDGLGPNALARFDRDVVAAPGVRYLIVLEGINDIGTFGLEGDSPQSAHDDLVARIIGAYRQIVLRAHAHGIRVFGGTLTPFVGSDYYHPGPVGEADREAVNKWIRAPGHFDAVIDFDRTVRDPAHPHHLLPAYDSGDHLHPSPAGYGAMANAIPLSLFVQ